ncbi:hypothetical protein [Streptomyces sp. WAC 05379]|uniref:hypothetical protein n=1 Tax=Streptomyces sp. WAC 05379 TaxID=2203207 RepID=UPI000F7449C0|nr:hypothetical protein [Streptomyces sp. WAC 05379]
MRSTTHRVFCGGSTSHRTHFIDDDQAEELVERAKALRPGVATVHKLEATPEVDHLADLAVVVGIPEPQGPRRACFLIRRPAAVRWCGATGRASAPDGTPPPCRVGPYRTAWNRADHI